MPLTFIESWNGCNNSDEALPKWNDANFSIGTTGRFGDANDALDWRSSLDFCEALSGDDGTTDELIIGFGVKMFDYTSDRRLVQFLDDTDLMLEIRMDTDGILTAVVDASTVLTCTLPTIEEVWHYIEFKVRLHATLGTAAFQIDGAAAGSDTGLDTLFNGTACDLIRWQGDDGQDWYLDDIYIANSSDAMDFLGDVRIISAPPTAEDQQEWTRSAGSSNHETIDDTAYSTSDTDGNDSNTATQVDSFDLATFGLVSGDIVHGVGVNVWCEKVDAGSADVKVLLRQGGTEFVGATETAVNAWQRFFHLWDEDPDLTTAWTFDGPDSSKPGYERQ